MTKIKNHEINKGSTYFVDKESWGSGSYQSKGKGNSLAAYLDDDGGKKVEIFDAIYEAMKSHLNGTEPRIHEIGCGPGFHLKQLLLKKKKFLISGSDVWEDAIKDLKKSTKIKAILSGTQEFVEKYAGRNKKSFDVVFSCAHLIHLTTEEINSLTQLSEVCKVAVFLENIQNLEDVFSDYKVTKIDRNSDNPSGWGDCRYLYIVEF